MCCGIVQPRESSAIAKPVSKLLLFYLQTSSDRLLTQCYPTVIPHSWCRTFMKGTKGFWKKLVESGSIEKWSIRYRRYISRLHGSSCGIANMEGLHWPIFFVGIVVCSKDLEWILGYCLRWSAVYPCQFLFLVNYWKLPVFWKDLKQICMCELLLYVLQHLHSRYVGSRPSRWQFSQFGWSTDRVERIKCDDMKYAGWFRTKLVSVHQTLELLRIIWPPWLHTVIWPWQHHRTGEHFSLESALTSQLLSWQVQGQCVCDSSKLTLPISHKVSSDIYSFWDEHSGNL